MIILWFPLIFGVVAVGGSEFISSHWQPDPHTKTKAGLYEDVLFYHPKSTEGLSIQILPIEEKQIGYLTHDRGRRYAMFDRKDSRGMELLILEYDGNNSRFFFDLFNHPPERCMASTGAQITARYKPETILVGGEKCLSQALKVTSPGSDEVRYIFKLIWVHPDYPLEYGASIHLKRIQAALATIPPPPARLFMAGLYGFSSEKDARAFFKANVTDQIKMLAL